jgi:hypothetical protein
MPGSGWFFICMISECYKNEEDSTLEVYEKDLGFVGKHIPLSGKRIHTWKEETSKLKAEST